MKSQGMPDTARPEHLLPPSAPTRLTAKPHYSPPPFKSEIRLAWRENTNWVQAGLVGLEYRVYRATGVEAFKIIGKTDQRSFHDSSVELNTEYRYHVTAFNRHGESGPSNEVKAKVVKPVVIPHKGGASH